ncbi:nuclear receptor 2C2-associated protein-like [Diadema antillarum]|uniref:nuclear receptor 2C2-associated protein-like n=1 Tax=Diadema antillarum TaxID=105358 RepID=UPI003A8C74E6
MAASLTQTAVTSRVSSVLNRDVKQFGKKFLFDNNEETCWNSDQGKPQWVYVEFQEPSHLKELHLQFQGGFASKTCWVEGSLQGDDASKVMDFYPKDDNTLQIFHFPDGTRASSVKIVFAESTDFFGRITLYKLDILGSAL